MQWRVREWEELPYCKTEAGFFVEVEVEIEGILRSCKLPVLDYSNRTVAKPNAFQINTSIQRALTKCFALHGMALYLYAGEDLPFAYGEETQEPVQMEDDLQRYQPIADAIIDKLSSEDLVGAGEIWSECSQDDMKALWVAKTKGGFFTQSEKDQIRRAIQVYKQANEETA